MKTDVVCPHCGKRLAKTGFSGELVYTLTGDILLWCKECRAEIPFRYQNRITKPKTEPLSR